MQLVDARGRVWTCRHTDHEVDPASTISWAGWCPYCGARFHEPRGFCRTRANRNGRLRARLVERDGNACRYCLREFSPELLATLDHIVPKSKGGGDDLTNLCLSCLSCNGFKGADMVPFCAFVGMWD